MGVLENTQVLGLSRVRRADQAGLHREVGLAETTAREKLIICDREERDELVINSSRDRGT